MEPHIENPAETGESDHLPDGAHPAASGEGFGRRELMLVAAAMVGSGTLMIGVLSARGGGEAATMSSNGASAAAAPVAVSHTAPPAALGWVENADMWTGAARRSTAFEVAARNETQVWMRTVRPLLVVRCIDGRIDTFVFTDSPAAMEAEDEDHAVRLAFDDDSPRAERWPDSSAHDALFAPNGAAFAAELMAARTFRFGYTPHNSAAVVAHFDVAGLRERIGSAKACTNR